MAPKESKLQRGEKSQVTKQAKEALKLLCANKKASTEGLAFLSEEELVDDLKKLDAKIGIKALRNFIDAYRNKEVTVDMDLEQLCYRLGYLYCKLAAEILGWELIYLKSDAMPNGGVAIVDAERKFSMFPPMYFYRLMTDPNKNNTLALTLNMIAGGDVPPVKAGSYTVMLG